MKSLTIVKMGIVAAAFLVANAATVERTQGGSFSLAIQAPSAHALFCCPNPFRAIARAVSSVASSIGNAAAAIAKKAAEVAAAAAAKVKEVAAAAARAAAAVAQAAAAAAVRAAQAIKDAAARAAALAAAAARAVAEAAAKAAQVIKDAAIAAAKVAAALAEKIAEGIRRLAELGREIANKMAELAKFTVGELGELISAFKSGPIGLLRHVANKMPGPVGKIVDALFFSGGSFGDRLKKVGDVLLATLNSFVDAVKNTIKSGIDNVINPLVSQVTGMIQNNVLKPALATLGSLAGSVLDEVAEKVAATILGNNESLGTQLGGLAGALSAVSKGNLGVVNDQLAKYNTSLDTVGKDAVNMALEHGLAWLRGKAVAMVMSKVNELMKPIWSWAYTGVALARNAVQGAVSAVPFAGGVLAAAVGTLVDFGWDKLKGLVDDFIEAQVNKLGDMATQKAKDLLAGGAAKVGGLLQDAISALRGPLQIIAQKVQAIVGPVLNKYKALTAKLQAVAAKK